MSWISKDIHSSDHISDSTLFADIVLTMLVLAWINILVVVVEQLLSKSIATIIMVTFVTSRLN